MESNLINLSDSLFKNNIYNQHDSYNYNYNGNGNGNNDNINVNINGKKNNKKLSK
jgi:hypothetical protein